MKLISFALRNGPIQVGALCGAGDGDRVVVLPFSNMLELIEKVGCDFKRLASIADEAQKNGSLHSRNDVTLLAPIPKPPTIRDGYAFRQHVETARKNRGLPMIPEFDLFPVFYFTNPNSVSGPGAVEVQTQHLNRLDFELEVAVVLGHGGRNIPAAKASDHVFGAMIMNDWSARALQMDEMKLNLGPAKGKDFATSLGPYLVTRDELERSGQWTLPGVLRAKMSAHHNGVLVSSGNAQDMNWSFAQLIERMSYGVTMYSGEVVGSGTVGTGCFLELNGSGVTKDLWLKPGDSMRLEVEGLGILENKIKLVTEDYQK